MSEATLFEALSAIQSELTAVGKDSTANAGGKYKYRGIDAVINALHPLLAKHGVTIAPHVVAHDLQQFTGYSKPHTNTILTVDYHVHGPDGQQLDPPVRAIGYGIDNTDKGPGKAMSYAYKSAISQLFSLPTDDPSMDNEQTPEPEHLMTDAQVSEVLDLCDQMPEESCDKLVGWVVEKLGVTFDRRGLGRLSESVGNRVVEQARKAAASPVDESPEPPVSVDEGVEAMRREVIYAVYGLDAAQLEAFNLYRAAEGLPLKLDERTKAEHLPKLHAWLAAESGTAPFDITVEHAKGEASLLAHGSD